MRLKHLLSLNDGGVWGDDPDGSNDVMVLRSTDISLDGSWAVSEPALRSVPLSERTAKRLHPGDLVVVKSSGSAAHLGKTALVSQDIAVTGACFANFVQRLRPSEEADPRFLWYFLNSQYAASQVEVLGNTTTGLRNLNGEILSSIECPAPAIAQQRAIADYLDAETARIDALITKKRRLIDLVHEDLEATIDTAIWSTGVPTPLMYLTPSDRQIMYGIVLPGPNVEDGVPIVKGGDVAARRLRLDALARTTREIEASYVRSRLRAGDLVYAIRGGVGDVEMVPVEIEAANITQDVARIAPATGISGQWLLFAVRSKRFLAQVEARVTGATIRGVNIWDLKRARVPLPDAKTQAAVANDLESELQTSERLVSALTRQIDLLAEHRQALITAAVTGELEVAGAA